MVTKFYLTQEAKAWLKKQDGPDEVLKVVPGAAPVKGGQCYDLYTAYDQRPVNLGRILFDTEGCWIYDGDALTIAEQEQLAHFIINYRERL